MSSYPDRLVQFPLRLLIRQLHRKVVQLPLYTHVADSDVLSGRLIKQLPRKVILFPPRMVSYQGDSLSRWPDISLSSYLEKSEFPQEWCLIRRLIEQVPGYLSSSYPDNLSNVPYEWCLIGRLLIKELGYSLSHYLDMFSNFFSE